MNSTKLPPPPFSFLQAREYTDIGYVTEFNYSSSIAHGIQDFGYLKQIADSGMLDSGHALVLVVNHENQRGHGADGHVLTFNTPHDYMLGQVGCVQCHVHRHFDSCAAFCRLLRVSYFVLFFKHGQTSESRLFVCLFFLKQTYLHFLALLLEGLVF